MRITDIHQRLADLGALPVHSGRVVRAWLQGKPLDAGTRRQHTEHFLPLSVRAGLPALAEDLQNLVSLRSEHPGADGSARLLVALADGQMVESVLLPRDGLCVSTQVGCAVGCVFCMTGKSGLLRQVGSAEIVAQVALARRFRPVKKVVFMGMGEPAHNLDNVLEAIDLLGTDGGIGHKNLVFSTVGDLRVFDRLPRERVKPALAPTCGSGCCPRHHASRRRNWWSWASVTPGISATRSSTSGPCCAASTTARRKWTASWTCSRASTRC
jgi:23S rRNA (adenine2503-C2)-methyltransferase